MVVGFVWIMEEENMMGSWVQTLADNFAFIR